MDLTASYEHSLPPEVINRYKMLEVRNAAAVLKASNPDLFEEVVSVLAEFKVYDADILVPGGNRSQIPIRLDQAFENLGWSAVRINTEFKLVGKRKLSATNQQYTEQFLESSVANDGFEVDNMKGRVALDVEWNAKDGNLDRDLSAYRALYDVGLIDVAVIITRDHYGIKTLALQDLNSADAARRLGTTTTTNIEKVQGRLTRGDAGGCPVLVAGITRATWQGHAD
ncbi:restriction endonuclease [Nocardia farcinica]|uniref:BglII/BstYI family type II restriction endonuclease n=1 Tax=Nocardia farcinica TaxID=37329 RepID=UPI001893B071|nr:BglII/BstYI family type II restriction endonuclease [Nocardia farcinica]MBF6260195.1 restriction endonuclease [Nocardia farcinica]MBF6271187.1 restriction endonuclease [Nocardia farcinica]